MTQLGFFLPRVLRRRSAHVISGCGHLLELGVCELVLGRVRLHKTQDELFPDPSMRRILALGWESVSRFGPGLRQGTQAIVRAYQQSTAGA